MKNSFEFIHDFHIHASGYRLGDAEKMTIDNSMIVEVIVRRAEEFGLKKICIIEHLEPVSGRHPWEEPLRVKREVEKIRDNTHITVLSGCEASIIDIDGNLSAPDKEIIDAGFDIVIASFHKMPYEVKDIDEFHDLALKMMIAAGKKEFVRIIGHPWRDTPKILKKVLPGFNWSFSLVPEEHVRKIAELSLENNVYLEISIPAVESSPEYSDFIRKLNKYGAFFSIGSDAHDLAKMRNAETISKTISDLKINHDQLMEYKK